MVAFLWPAEHDGASVGAGAGVTGAGGGLTGPCTGSDVGVMSIPVQNVGASVATFAAAFLFLG